MDGQNQTGCKRYGYTNTKHQPNTGQHSICPRSEKQKFMQECLLISDLFKFHKVCAGKDFLDTASLAAVSCCHLRAVLPG